MNSQLTSAINALKAVGAQDLPLESEIQKAPNGTSWHRKKGDGSDCSLTKNSETSYNTTC